VHKVSRLTLLSARPWICRVCAGDARYWSRGRARANRPLHDEMDSSHGTVGITVPDRLFGLEAQGKEEESAMDCTTIAVDLAKTVFEVAVSHRPGQIAMRKRLSRSQFLRFFLQQPPATVLLEACGSSHHWGRELQRLGHRVQLLPPHHVRRYRAGNKTDTADAKALLEAYRNEAILPVPIKSVEQQALTALHRLRSRLLATRTARINTLRGLLREFGHIVPKGGHLAARRLQGLIEDSETSIPEILRPGFLEICREIRSLSDRMAVLERHLEILGRDMPVVAHLRSIPGIGVLSATALVGFVGDIRRFRSCRHFASYLGITPREYSSGETRHRGHITKHGDVYLRMLLIHGARSLLATAPRRSQPDPLRQWAQELARRRGHTVATVALANRLARIAWTVWREDRDFVERARVA
jgi:transposase